MTESPFVTVHNLIAEPPCAIAELRIIARDGRGLKLADRETLVRAADELDLAQRQIRLLYAQLLEAQHQLAAVGDQLRTLRPAPALFEMHISSGPLACGVQVWGGR